MSVDLRENRIAHLLDAKAVMALSRHGQPVVITTTFINVLIPPSHSYRLSLQWMSTVV